MTKSKSRRLWLAGACLVAVPIAASAQPAARVTERLDRGVVAVPAQGGGVLVSWRLLRDDPKAARFEVYRDGRRISSTPVTDSTNFVDRTGDGSGRYAVRMTGARATAGAPVWKTGYLSIPLVPPADGVTPAGDRYGYTANDASVGDLDGDGCYEIILKWDPTNSHDNSQAGYTGDVFVDAYTLDRKRLWRIDLGRNIRAGAHYTQFQVADYDGDGRAEVAMKTADGTVDGTGMVIGDKNADWRGGEGEVPQRDRTGAKVLADGTKVARLEGRILKGPEFLTYSTVAPVARWRQRPMIRRARPA